MSVLSGNRDTDLLILQKLTDYELTQVCQVNKKVQNLCNDRNFWINRTKNRFPFLNDDDVLGMNKYLGFNDIKELYKYLISFPTKYDDRYYIDRNYIVSLFKNEQLLNDVINELIDLSKAPEWVDRIKLLYNIRRTFPQRFLERKANNDKKLQLFFLSPQIHEFEEIFNKPLNLRYETAKSYDQFKF